MQSTTVTPSANIGQALAAVSAKITRNPRATVPAQSDDAPRDPTGKAIQSTGKSGERSRAQSKSRGRRKTKASIVEAMLKRKSGATLEQIGKATNWQPHTCRAFLSGLRKKGAKINRLENKNGKSVYRIEPSDAPREVK
ncbi:MAG: DUF3489 domain-containing protein [Pseudomonadota bacterium]